MKVIVLKIGVLCFLAVAIGVIIGDAEQEREDEFESADFGTTLCEKCGRIFKWYKEVTTEFETVKIPDNSESPKRGKTEKEAMR